MKRKSSQIIITIIHFSNMYTFVNFWLAKFKEKGNKYWELRTTNFYPAFFLGINPAFLSRFFLIFFFLKILTQIINYKWKNF